MKKNFLSIFLILVCYALTACHTPLYIPPIEKSHGDFGQPNMDFRGFINGARDEKCAKTLSNFGRELERNHIAVNNQVYSLGSMFSFEDLNSIQSDSRYISFVNILDFRISYNDEIEDKINLKRAGWWIAGLTLFTFWHVYVPLLCAGDVDKCLQYIKFEGELCVYDSQTQQIIYNDLVKCNYKQIYEGQYKHKDTNKRVLEASERSVLTNVLLESYGKAHEFIDQQIIIQKEEAERALKEAQQKKIEQKAKKKTYRKRKR